MIAIDNRSILLGLHWLPAEQEDSRTEQIGAHRRDVQQKTAAAGANDQADRPGNNRGRRSGRSGRGGGSNVSALDDCNPLID